MLDADRDTLQRGLTFSYNRLRLRFRTALVFTFGSVNKVLLGCLTLTDLIFGECHPFSEPSAYLLLSSSVLH